MNGWLTKFIVITSQSSGWLRPPLISTLYRRGTECVASGATQRTGRPLGKEVSMGIDRTVAATWSKDRIKEELSDLRRQIAEFTSEAEQLRAEADELVAAIDSGEHPYSRSSDPYKHTDPMYDSASRLDDAAARLESDIEFLKSLL